MADTFKEWASKQIHRPEDKITNSQKLTSKYVLNKYKTWGDVYKAAGISTPNIPKKDQIQPTALKASTVLSELNINKRSIQLLQDEINRQETGSPAYKKLIGEYNSLQIKISNLTNQYEDLNSIEKNIDKVDAARKKTGNLKSQITSLENARKRTADLGQDTKSIDAQIKKLKGLLTDTRKIVETTDVTPNYVPPKEKIEKPIPSSRSPIANRDTVTGPKGPTEPVIVKKDGASGLSGLSGLSGTANGKGTSGGKSTSGGNGASGAPIVDREADALAAAADLTLSETLFKNIPSLNAILKKYINTPGMTTAALLKEIRADLWYKQNSEEIKARYVQYYNYRDLQASGQATGTTDYEKQIASIEAYLQKRAVELGSAAANDPAALRKAAENLYITNRSEDVSFITDFLAASIGTTSGMIGGKVTEGYSGQALTNYKLLVEAARDNGFQVSDIIPGGSSEQQVLQGIASGKIDINRVIADTRKLAAQGQPSYVRDLLAQGLSLKQIFTPYRQIMSNVLEIGDPDQIDLNDPLLRSAITDKGDMNTYDFKKLLRQDNRWQYTQAAKTEVADTALRVLRDFGFQG